MAIPALVVYNVSATIGSCPSFQVSSAKMPVPPHVTVIMPVRNEAGFIRHSLGAVLDQDYPKDRTEVLIADGMSTDSTRTIIRELAEAQPRVSVEVIDNPGGIVPTGFNAALMRARGDVIVRVDGHTIIDSDYVAECVKALEETGADNVGGKMRAVGEGAIAEAVALATSSPFGVGGAKFHYADSDEWVDTVYLGAWRRTTFQRIGPFDEEMVRNQDDEFNYRLRKAGGRILLRQSIKSRYFNRSSLKHLWRQYFQYGFWKVRVMQKHSGQMQLRQYAPLALVSCLLAGGALSFIPIVRFAWLTVVLTYVTANLAASLLIAARNGWRHFPILPIVFGTLHISYGTGFLAGLAKFSSAQASTEQPNDR